MLEQLCYILITSVAFLTVYNLVVKEVSYFAQHHNANKERPGYIPYIVTYYHERKVQLNEISCTIHAQFIRFMHNKTIKQALKHPS